ncbi:MAG: Lrp/AsnC family transcriptional regulator [Clostridia bacterium]|nr:MAG: Lrp/AsnC family transcriptional regulator [Clostridia bacterium]
MLSQQEKQVISLLQGNLPLTPRPFAALAEQAGMTEDEFIETTRKLMSRGVIRRLAGIIRHREAGIAANAMVVWHVPPEQAARVGEELAAAPEVTHCYERPATPEWPYNLYAMIHGTAREECEEIAAKLAARVGISNYRTLFSTAELKKTSMTYF